MNATPFWDWALSQYRAEAAQSLLLRLQEEAGLVILEEIATEYAGKVKVCKVDVDANPDMPGKFNIRGIPTLIMFKGGNAVDTKVGALSKTQLSEFVDSVA